MRISDWSSDVCSSDLDIQDRDGAPLVLAEIVRRFPWLRHVFADGGYAGEKLRDALRRIGKWTLEIVKRSDTAKGFVVLPRRWVVERTLAWLNRNRRLAKDFAHNIASATAWLLIASIQLFTRRIDKLANYDRYFYAQNRGVYGKRVTVS